MSVRDDFLKENAERMKECERNISALLSSLGQKGIDNSILFDIPAGKRLANACIEAIRERDNAESKLDALRFATNTHKEQREQLDESGKALKITSAKVKDLVAKLGAIVYEKCTFSALDKTTFAPIYREVEVNSFFFQQRKNEKFFYKYGRLVLDLKLDRALDGKALEIAETIRAAEGERDRLEGERQSLSNIVRSTRQNPFAKDSVEKAEKEYKAKVEKAASALESYGTFLYDQYEIWINDDTPNEIFDVFQLILNERNHQEAIMRERNRMGREERADDYKTRLEAEESKISILKRERELLDTKILEAEREADRLRSAIEKLNTEIKKGNRK